MASFASVFGKGKGKADDAKQDDKKASSPTPKPVKPVVLTHCRPHATMPVLEVNLYKKDFADAEALNRFHGAHFGDELESDEDDAPTEAPEEEVPASSIDLESRPSSFNVC